MLLALRWRRRTPSQTGEKLVSFELWRVPALTDDFGRGHLILTVDP